MGVQRSYLGNGNFSEYLYETIVGTEQRINDLNCKVIKLIADKQGTHSNMPQYSATSDVYLILGADGKVKQMGVYKDYKLDKDFDWTYPHTNPGNKQKFPKGVVHVHPDVNHQTDARYMDDAEMMKYGNIIHYYNADAKLRP